MWIPEKFQTQLLRVSVRVCGTGHGCEGQDRAVRPVIQLSKDRSVSFTATRFCPGKVEVIARLTFFITLKEERLQSEVNV